MREKRAGVVFFDEVDLTQEQFDQPIFWLLAALLAFMPAALGSWDAWAEAIALAGACSLGVILCVKLLKRSDLPFVWSWAYLPIALFLLLVGFQLLSLPAGLISTISPRTLATNQALLGDLPGAAERLKHLRISFYVEGAWHDLRNLIAVVIIFVVVINVFRRADQMIRLLWVIAWVGAAQAALSILQNLTHTPYVYWLFPVWGDANGGTFPNHNCFAQFMNLSIGAMTGLLLLKIDQTFRRHDYDPAEVMEKLTSADFRWAWVLAAMLVISIASIFISLSRGGMLSCAIAGVVVGILLALRGGIRGMGLGGWILGVILVIVFSLVMAGGANLVENRIARIGNPDDRFDRFQLTRDTLRAWKDYPAVGMGLGSFRFTFQSYDRSNVGAVASHAENEYAELLEETGVAGAAIAGSFLLIIFACFLRARARGKTNRDKQRELEDDASPVQPFRGSIPDNEAREPGRSSGGGRHRHRKQLASPASSLSLGLCFGLVAILVHSTADFGQHCISIASLTAISCALLVNLARVRRRERGLEREPIAVRGWKSIRGGALGLVVLVSIALLWQANSALLAAAAYQRETKLAEQLADHNWQGDHGDFTDMNHAADEAASTRPGDMRYRYWRAMNRWYTISDVHDPVSGDVVLSDDKRKVLDEMAADLQDARWICPTFGPLYAQLGQWEQNFLNRPADGARHIRMAYDLAPGDATICFILATLDVEEDAGAASVAHFKRAVQLLPSMLGDVIDLYVGYFHRPDLALQFADGSVERLRLVSSSIRALGKDPANGPTTGPATRAADEAVALETENRADMLVRAAADRPDASPKTLGEMGMVCSRRNDPKGAIMYLGRALEYEYGETDWRLELARDLARLGREDDARHQLQIILHAHPNLDAAEIMLNKLSLSTTNPYGDFAN